MDRGHGLDARLLADDDIWSAAFETDWRALRARAGGDQPPHADPGWLRIQASTGGGSGDPRLAAHGSEARVAAVWDGSRLAGVAPFLVHRHEWPARLGYTTVARFSVRRAILCGETPLVDTPEAEPAMLHALCDAAADLDVLCFEGVPSGSWLTHLQTDPQVADRYWIDVSAPSMRHRVRFPEIGSFERYAAERFNGKTRRTLAYKVRKLEKEAPKLTVDRITTRAQVEPFLTIAEHISRVSWKGTRLGYQFVPEVQLPRLLGYADLGWLRSYVLRNGDEPIAIIHGLQVDDVFAYENASYDPRWAIHHPGTVLVYRMLEDVCAHRPAAVVDFGYGDNEYKRVFSNESHEERTVRLVRKGAYNALALGTSRACDTASSAARTALDRWGLREHVRALLRGKSGAAPSASP